MHVSERVTLAVTSEPTHMTLTSLLSGNNILLVYMLSHCWACLYSLLCVAAESVQHIVTVPGLQCETCNNGS
jgi:hypothetical protein